ncbi:flagellar basal body P-ring formation chaperone FlgA [bacterium]|nr:flagellar basal body P-ring formation chaperone FlgA [bacterium]
MRYIIPFTFFAIIALGAFETGESSEIPPNIERFFTAEWPDSGFSTVWEPVKGSHAPELPEGVSLSLVSAKPLRFQGPMLLTFQADGPGNFEKRFSIRGTLRVFGPGLMPRMRIPKGQALSLANVRAETVEWTGLIGTPLRDTTDIGDKVAARTLVPGRPILVEHVCNRPVVKVGQEIDVETTLGNIRASVRARVLQDGAPGDIIRVLLSSSSKSIKVRLYDAKTAVPIE